MRFYPLVLFTTVARASDECTQKSLFCCWCLINLENNYNLHQVENIPGKQLCSALALVVQILYWRRVPQEKRPMGKLVTNNALTLIENLGIYVATVGACWCAPIRSIPLKGCY